MGQSRRQFLRRATRLGVSLASLPLCAGCAVPLVSGRQPARTPRIGYLGQGPRPIEGSASVGAFRQGLRERGYVEGQTMTIEWRFAESPDQLADFVAELVRLNLDLIVVEGTPQALAGKQATSTIPIVMASADDPVEAGLVASLSRPGGNVTGLSFLSLGMWGKQLELLKDTIPALSRAAVLSYRANRANVTALKVTEDAARSLHVELQAMEVRGPDDFEVTFEAASRQQAGAIINMALPLSLSLRTLIADLAARYRLPSAHPDRSFVVAGGLLSYGPSLTDNYRRAATYVDQILKGAKPAELPVQQPTTFDCVINLRAAQALGLTISQAVLLQATEVIQ